MKILIVGGTGFVGSYLSKHLVKNHEVKITSRSLNNSDFVYIGEKDELLKVVKEKFNLIINNLAPDGFSNKNLENCIKSISNYCIKNSSNLIQISSIFASIYNREYNDYSFKKALCEDIIVNKMAADKYAILRFPQLFDYDGKARKTQTGLYWLAESILKKHPISLYKNHNECLRNYMPVELLLKIIDSTIENNITGLQDAYFNDFTLPIKDLIYTMAEAMHNKKFKPIFSSSKNKGFVYKISTNNSIFEELIKRENISFYIEKFMKSSRFE